MNNLFSPLLPALQQAYGEDAIWFLPGSGYTQAPNKERRSHPLLKRQGASRTRSLKKEHTILPTTKKNTAKPQQTIAQMITMPLDNRHTRRILEITSPIRLFVEIDQFGRACLLGATNQEGHFQVGALISMQQWTPAQDQSDMLWKQKKEAGITLHMVQRNQRICATGWEIALVQHTLPTPTTPDINLVTITPLWDKHQTLSQRDPTLYQALRSYTCYLMLQCSCPLYASLLQKLQVSYRGPYG